MSLIEPGTYTARIVAYSLTENSKGDPQVAIRFSFTDKTDQERQLTWYGGFSEKGMKFTMKALVVCGLNRELEALAEGVEGGALDTGHEVSIVVAQESDQEGKLRNKINWVNRLGGGAFKNALNRQQAQSKLAKINWKGELEAARKDLGISGSPRKPAVPGQDYDPNFDRDADENYNPGF